MTSRQLKPHSPKTQTQEAAVSTGNEEHRDWFFDELMTPQPDATQDFLRRRLEALAKKHASKTSDHGDQDEER